MKRINILITDEQHKKLSERSKRIEVSISEQIRISINNYFSGDLFISENISHALDKIKKENNIESLI